MCVCVHVSVCICVSARIHDISHLTPLHILYASRVLLLYASQVLLYASQVLLLYASQVLHCSALVVVCCNWIKLYHNDMAKLPFSLPAVQVYQYGSSSSTAHTHTLFLHTTQSFLLYSTHICICIFLLCSDTQSVP